MRQKLLQNVTAILLQNATEVYYKMCQVFYFKMRQLLQNAMILLQNATVITKCDVYCKLRQCTVQIFKRFFHKKIAQLLVEFDQHLHVDNIDNLNFMKT